MSKAQQESLFELISHVYSDVLDNQGLSLYDAVALLKSELIEIAVENTKSQFAAAKYLGISRANLLEYSKRYNIELKHGVPWHCK